MTNQTSHITFGDRVRADGFDEPPVVFYGGPFSNFYGGPFAVELSQDEPKLCFPWSTGDPMYLDVASVEHFFQACKPTTQAAFSVIVRSMTPGMAKVNGNRCVLRADWDDVRYEIMLIGLRAKFATKRFRRALLATEERGIYEDSPTDGVWGVRVQTKLGPRFDGLNLLGTALMAVREELR